jgi:hypothetical protein
MWNNFALIDSLELVTGVYSAETNGLVGHSGMISYNKIGDTKYLDFSLEWQDCFDGCDASRTWKFKVFSDCSVEYLGYTDYCYWSQFGILCDAIPEPLNCGLFTEIPEKNMNENNIVLYPNPTEGKFYIQLKNKKHEEKSYLEVCTMKGGVVYQSALNNTLTEIDLSNFINGEYLIYIFDGQSVFTKKITVF